MQEISGIEKVNIFTFYLIISIVSLVASVRCRELRCLVFA